MEKVRVMVVEDDEGAALLVKLHLEKIGYEVVAMAQSPTAALEAYAKIHPDVVLMDIHLSGHMDGVTMAETISLGRSGVPLIFLRIRRLIRSLLFALDFLIISTRLHACSCSCLTCFAPNIFTRILDTLALVRLGRAKGSNPLIP